eukprot:1611713-Amphidinium_carterae.2
MKCVRIRQSTQTLAVKGRVIDALAMIPLVSNRHAARMGRKPICCCQKMAKGSMQYITENQFEFCVWRCGQRGLKSVKEYDAQFWRDVVFNGFVKYLKQIHTPPVLCFGETMKEETLAPPPRKMRRMK